MLEQTERAFARRREWLLEHADEVHGLLSTRFDFDRCKIAWTERAPRGRR